VNVDAAADDQLTVEIEAVERPRALPAGVSSRPVI
jgi:hypothetical protein